MTKSEFMHRYINDYYNKRLAKKEGEKAADAHLYNSKMRTVKRQNK